MQNIEVTKAVAIKLHVWTNLLGSWFGAYAPLDAALMSYSGLIYQNDKIAQNVYCKYARIVIFIAI